MALIPDILGAAFGELPAAVRRIHGGSPLLTASGLATVDRAPGLGAWLVCTVAGLPVAGRNIPVTVTFSADGRNRERWRRQFAARRYASSLAVGRQAYEVAEYLGPFTLFHTLNVEPNGLRWIVTRWRVLGIPLPRWSAPTTDAFESEDGGRFTFDIKARFPLIGPVISYHGWLLPTN